MAGHEDKAKRYIALLDDARVEGKWAEFPELIRKVTKHAPKQEVLIRTATAEHKIAQPQAAATDKQTAVIESLESLLREARNPASEENYQARSAILWAHWVDGSSPGTDVEQQYDVLGEFDRYGQKGTSPWTKICMLKNACFHSANKSQYSRPATFKAAIAWIELNLEVVRTHQQTSYWAQQLLAHVAMQSADDSSLDTETSRAYSLFSKLIDKRTRDATPQTYGNPRAHLPRGLIWKSYYEFVTKTVQHGSTTSHAATTRSKQAAMVRMAESAYETEMLATKKFPRATETNAEVEAWVESVIKTWQIVSNPPWHDSDLGEGGRNAWTRNVLDILYRAASKTFHSTLILRRLFQVHKSLAEFDLAYKCFDTYVELAERGRERIAKSGDSDPNQDSDEHIFSTMAEAVEGLCAYGHQKEAQKAYEIAIKLENYLDELEDSGPRNGFVNGTQDSLLANDTYTTSSLSDTSKQILYRALGIAKAHWAHWTPFSGSRAELQSEALEALKKACNFSTPQPTTVYALALLLAETRDVQQAVQWTKLALEQVQSPSQGREYNTAIFWHLMALLLSARQDFETADQSCTAAAQQLQSLGVLGGRNAHASTASSIEKPAALPSNVVEMEAGEMQRIIEIHISHLAMTELLEGTEAAINSGRELIGLFSVLFRRFDLGTLPPTSTKELVPPKSSAGTVKSVRGSLFGRNRPLTSEGSASNPSTYGGSVRHPAPSVRPATQASQAPTIQVTDESGKGHKHKHHLFHHSDHEKLAPQGTITKGEKHAPTPNDTSQVQHDFNAKQELNHIPHGTSEHDRLPPPPGHDDQPPEQDVRLPNVHAGTKSTTPGPKFSKTVAQKHALTVLAKIWLTIAMLYRRAHMFDDARDAAEEANRTAIRIENLVLANDPSARALVDAGWGGGKSSDEVSADVHCEKAELQLAIAQRQEVENVQPSPDAMRDAVAEYELCLMYYPNHASGIIGLSNLLLDHYERKIDLSKHLDNGTKQRSKSTENETSRPSLERSITDLSFSSQSRDVRGDGSIEAEDLRKTPENLNRIAARDRAYGLLSTLTKLGHGWDNSEAWFALARAQELGGEIEKAKNILWWCVELEDTRPIRHWRNLGCTGYVL